MPTEPTPTRTATAPKSPSKPAPKKKTPAKAAPLAQGQFTVDSFLTALKLQESGGNYSSRSKSSSASGAYQYIDSTWNNYGGYAHAWQAPPAVQDARARADITAAYSRYGGDWQKVAAAHFAGAGWVAAHPDKNTWGQNPAPGSQNPTVSSYVSSLFGKAGQTAPEAVGGVATAHAAPQEVKDQVAAKYGYLSGFLDNPELGPILQQAAQEGWDIDRLQGAIYATKWYKTHAAVTRQFDSQGKLDPATQQRQIMTQADDILAQAKRAGIVLDHTTLAKLAWTSLRYGWSGQQLTNAIVAQGKMDISGATPGGALTTADNLKELAAQYLVPVSQAALTKWVKDIQSGTIAQQDFVGYLKEQAKSLFPGMSVAIDSGVTPAHYVDPYKQIAANTLEVPADSVNFLDPKWSKALFQTDPKTGARTSMSLSDWQTTLRTDPHYGYDQTEQARTTAADLTTQLAKQFGAIG